MATLQENLQRIATGKASMKASIEAKGVAVPASAHVETYHTYIDNISTGLEEIKVDYFYNADGTVEETIPSGKIVTAATISMSNKTLKDRLNETITAVTKEDLYGMTEIPDYAFAYQGVIVSIEIPETVTSMGSNIVADSRSLERMYIYRDTPGTIGDETFSGWNGDILVPSYSVETYKEDWITSNWQIKSMPTTLLYETTDDNPINLTGKMEGAVLLSNGVNKIKNRLEAKYDAVVTGITPSAFISTFNLKYFDIPYGVEDISTNSFNGCTGMTGVRIPGTVTKISSNAFQNCPSLTSVTIPNLVTELGGYCFGDCTGLQSIYIKALEPPTNGGDCFYGSTCPIYIPSGRLEVYQTAYPEYNDRLQEV